VNNITLLRALVADLQDLADNLETLDDACYRARGSSRFNPHRPNQRNHKRPTSDPTGETVSHSEQARHHFKEADKMLRGPIISFMGRLQEHDGVNYHVRQGMKTLSKGPDQRARHDAGEAPRESA